jgi:2',3'-cyclic-nucleotide 2'-phosphodiesterase (5'-nucleotidase family)
MVFFRAFSLSAQVRLFQLSDAHSSLETIGSQMQAIDSLASDFLVQNPKGEVVIYILGDYTSINSFSQKDGGWLSYRALKIFKDKGYTVLFTPGNHDAFDWSGKVDGAELFLQQMQKLNEWGIPILAANIEKPTKPFKNFISKSYPLRTLKTPTHIVGMTLDVLLKKSNLSDQRAPRLFENIGKYEVSIDRALKDLRDQGVEQVLLGIHQGHLRLAELAKRQKQTGQGEIIHYMGADDHLVASYVKKGALITDAGAYGSFNVIDYNKKGDMVLPVLHVSINKDSYEGVSDDIFKGDKRLNSVKLHPSSVDPDIFNYASAVQKHIDEVKASWDRTLAITEGFKTHKMHMKLGRTELGSLLSEAMVLWARAKLSYVDGLDLIGEDLQYSGPIVSMVNSSSYRVEESIPAGPLTELMVREMYPYLNEATIYKLSGEVISKLFFKLREIYAEGDSSKYTPQLNFGVRENNGVLEFFANGTWHKLKKKTMYPVVFDGWLSTHRYGQGFKIKSWIKTLSKNLPIATEAYQDILVSFFPKAVENLSSSKNQCSQYLM